MLIEQAIASIKSGARVFIQGCAGTPKYLNRLLANRANELKRVEIVSLLLLDDVFSKPECKGSFFLNNLFVSGQTRQSLADGSGSYVPSLFNDMPRLFENNVLPLDVAFLHVSPPDSKGYCSLGNTVSLGTSAIRNAKKIFAQINKNMPRVHGDTFIHINKIDAFVEHDEPLMELDYSKKITDLERNIGKRVAELIDDGSTLQLGIGTIPDCVLLCLNNHKDLSIASEMISDGVATLMEKGVITNRYKTFYPGSTTCTFMMGTRKLYDFVHDNPKILSFDVATTNDPFLIRQNPKMIAINSAIEIDLTGQICAESMGLAQYSGVGGQLDFMYGSALSKGGKPILVLPSQTVKGVSRIVPTLRQGAGVTTTRAHVHYVVTEYGVVNLFGKNFQQRAKALIDIAHPDHRSSLERAAFERFKSLY